MIKQGALLFYLVCFLQSATAAEIDQQRCSFALSSILFLSQLDPRVKEAKLWSENVNSRICGLSCGTFVYKILRTLKGKGSEIDDIVELKKILIEVEKQLKKDHLALRALNGVPPETLAKATQNYLRGRGITSAIAHKIVYSIYDDKDLDDVTHQDFASREGEIRFVILNVHGGPKFDQNILVSPSLSHAMLVTEFNSKEQLITVVDPFKPNLPLHGRLKEVNLYGKLTFTVEFDRPLISEAAKFLFYINDAILIDTPN